MYNNISVYLRGFFTSDFYIPVIALFPSRLHENVAIIISDPISYPADLSSSIIRLLPKNQIIKNALCRHALLMASVLPLEETTEHQLEQSSPLDSMPPRARPSTVQSHRLKLSENGPSETRHTALRRGINLVRLVGKLSLHQQRCP